MTADGSSDSIAIVRTRYAAMAYLIIFAYIIVAAYDAEGNAAVDTARLVLGPKARIQAPPNLADKIDIGGTGATVVSHVLTRED